MGGHLTHNCRKCNVIVVVVVVVVVEYLSLQL